MGTQTVLALVAALIASAGAPEAPPRPSPLPKPSPGSVFPTHLEEVHVSLSVRDAKGKAVTALGADDFVVTEDGRPQTIQLFARGIDEGQDSAAAREALALDLGLLLDTSSSMLKELKLSQEAASRFLEAIPRARELYTIFFDEDIRVSRYDSENQQGLFDRIHAAKGGGNTALYDAIAVYLSRVQDGPGRKVLVLFTDGEDTHSALPLPDVLKLVRSGRVTIYAIAFGVYTGGPARSLRPRAVLEQLAAMTGGQVFTPRSSRDLAGIYDRILEDLAAQYVVGYISDNPARDGRFRKIKVTAKSPGLTVRHRTGYTLNEDEPAPQD
jgi:Ca-activated chloride channel family protein